MYKNINNTNNSNGEIMNYRIKDLPVSERPRERLKEIGISNLSNKELLAIILKTGTKDKNVNMLAVDILNKSMDIPYKFQPLKRISLHLLVLN